MSTVLGTGWLHPVPAVRRAVWLPSCVVVACACLGAVLDHTPSPCTDASSDGPQYACWLQQHPQP